MKIRGANKMEPVEVRWIGYMANNGYREHHCKDGPIYLYGWGAEIDLVDTIIAIPYHNILIYARSKED